MILRGGKKIEGLKRRGNGESLHDEHDDHDKNIEKEVSTPSNDGTIDDMHNSDGVPKDSKYTSPKPYTPPLPFLK